MMNKEDKSTQTEQSSTPPNKNKGGRKKIAPEKQKHYKEVKIGFSKEEYEQIQKLLPRPNTPLSPFLRELILTKKVIIKETNYQFNKDIMYQLSRIGGNLNQYLKVLRGSKTLEIVKVEKNIKDLHKIIEPILDQMNNTK